MSSEWDVDSYREEHESEEHWLLRRNFMERWKSNYPEERLVCLARVFANIELLGCRYPPEVMKEIAGLSHEVAQEYRKSRKNKLQRTFVSASTAAEDRARGVKRQGGIVVDTPPAKSAKINFVPQGFVTAEANDNSDTEEVKNTSPKNTGNTSPGNTTDKSEGVKSEMTDYNKYLENLTSMKCLDVRRFHERMFHTSFGQFVLLIRPWSSKFTNILSSCQACNIPMTHVYENGFFSLTVNGKLFARASGSSKDEGRSAVEEMAWNRMRDEAISVFVKEQWIAHGGERVTASHMTKDKSADFGTPVETSIAAKMMQMMGWKGGGLGADAQGIAEPIKPHLQMVNRAGLGSTTSGIKELRRAAKLLMQKFIASDSIGVDLVFTSDFSKDERAALHQVARQVGLVSKSYGHEADNERFLVVRKKLDPFSIVRAVVDKGGDTPKYRVFIPASLQRNR